MLTYMVPLEKSRPKGAEAPAIGRAFSNGMAKSLSITFVRGARRVTGAQFLVEARDPSTSFDKAQDKSLGAGGKTTRILIDCGLAQGERFCESVNADMFPYDPSAVDAVFFTHAHADHIGLFPKLVKDGFTGKAYATPPTKDLLPIMLQDTAHLLADEAKRCKENPLYGAEDVAAATALVQGVSYGEEVRIASGITAVLHNAGHIIGSASVLLDIFGTRVLFTGDLGRVPAALVSERDVPKDVDYLICESVYGARVHEAFEESERVLLDTVRSTVSKNGILLIPAFSLERTQILLEVLDRAVTAKAIPSIPVFLDSPLAAKVTEVYRANPEYLREDIRKRLASADDPFSFPNLSVTIKNDESHAIDDTPNPKIIIAGAGMSHGGRIRRHEMKYLPDKATTLLLVGYQVAGSLGRRLKDGAKEVTMDGTRIPVHAEVRSTEGFSAHADRDDLMDFVEQVKPKEVFVVLGETASATFLAQRINGFLGIPTTVPREGEVVHLSTDR